MRHLMGLKELYFVRLGQLRDTRPKVYFIVIPSLFFVTLTLSLSLTHTLTLCLSLSDKISLTLSFVKHAPVSCYQPLQKSISLAIKATAYTLTTLC